MEAVELTVTSLNSILTEPLKTMKYIFDLVGSESIICRILTPKASVKS
jgi:hypothetical protein